MICPVIRENEGNPANLMHTADKGLLAIDQAVVAIPPMERVPYLKRVSELCKQLLGGAHAVCWTLPPVCSNGTKQAELTSFDLFAQSLECVATSLLKLSGQDMYWAPEPAGNDRSEALCRVAAGIL
eukprot:SAG11_NODE_13185_length_666_cov_1.102293_1_plen_125_part_10